MGSTCPETKEETYKNKKKVKCFIELDSAKFRTETDVKPIFNDAEWEEERNKLNFYNKDLTGDHMRLIDSMLEVNKVMENVCTNSKEHCHLCKIMNTTQYPFRSKTFQERTFAHGDNIVQLTPQWLIDAGEMKLCEEC